MMASPVFYQPTSSKSEKEDSKALDVNKILPDKKTLDKMIDDEKTLGEKTLKKILPDKRFLRKVSPTSETVVKLLDGVHGVVINQKMEEVETVLGMITLGCCKVKNDRSISICISISSSSQLLILA